METMSLRKQTAFRLRTDLLERLKIESQKHNSSLNNYVESVLMDIVYRRPNKVTMQAIDDARKGHNLETLDLDNFDKFVDSL